MSDRSPVNGMVVAVAAVLAAAPAGAARVPMATPLSEAGYERIARSSGVSVYKHRDADVIQLGADARIDAPPDAVMRALLDYEGQVGVIGRLSEVKVLRRAKGQLTVYQRLNLPVIDDRDFTLDVRYGQAGETRWISYHALKRGGPPPRDGVVRVTDHSGSWQLRPVDGGRATLARFMVRIDLSGWLPKWMARSGSGKEVPELFKQVRVLADSHRSNDGRIAWSSK